MHGKNKNQIQFSGYIWGDGEEMWPGRGYTRDANCINVLSFNVGSRYIGVSLYYSVVLL